jgi:hypothetical protein
VKRLILIAASIVLVTGGCGPSETPQQKAAARLQKAEAAMNACKEKAGLASSPTPTTVLLADPATAGQPLTPETADQLRMKVQCRPELDELLGARRDAGR